MTILALVVLVAFVAASMGFGLIQTVLVVALAASAAILTTLLAVTLKREGY